MFSWPSLFVHEERQNLVPAKASEVASRGRARIQTTLLAVPVLSMLRAEVNVKVPESVLACECCLAEPGRSCGQREVATDMRLLEIDADGRVRDAGLGGRHDDGWRRIYVALGCADRILTASSRLSVIEPELGFTD